MKNYLTAMLLIAIYCAIPAQTVQHSGSFNNSLANSNLASIDFWNSQNNPSVAVFLNKSYIGLDVSNRFMQKDINSAMLLGNIRINKRNAVILSLSSFGNNYYNQNLASVAYSIQLAENLSSALEIDGSFLKIYSEVSKDVFFSPAIKILVFYNVNDNLSISPKYYMEKHFENYGNKLIQEISIGASYLIDKNLRMFFSLKYGNNSKIDTSVGLLIVFNDKISVQLGVKSRELALSFGCSFQLKAIRIVSSFVYRQYLGFSPSASIQKTFN